MKALFLPEILGWFGFFWWGKRWIFEGPLLYKENLKEARGGVSGAGAPLQDLAGPLGGQPLRQTLGKTPRMIASMSSWNNPQEGPSWGGFAPPDPPRPSYKKAFL